MRIFPRSLTFAAVLVFLASTVFVCGLGIGGAWIFARVPHPVRRASQVTGHAAVSRSDGRARLRDGWLSGEECAGVVRELSADALRDLLRGWDADFWRSNPNAGSLLRQAGCVLARGISPESFVVEIGALLQDRKLGDGTRRRLLVAAFAGFLETRTVAEPELVAALRKVEPGLALALLEVWLDFQKADSPQNDLARGLRIAAQIFPKVDDAVESDVTALVVRLWAHRAPPAATALLFSVNFKKRDLRERLLAEGARMLAVADPNRLQQRMVEFGPQMLAIAGNVALDVGFTVKQARDVAAQMPEKAGKDFLGSYLRGLSGDDPREMSKVAAAFSAKELAGDAACAVVGGLMRSRDHATLEHWIEGEDAKTRAHLWNVTMNSWGSLPDPADVRYYLEQCPRGSSENFWGVRTALRVLPLDEAEKVLEASADIPGANLGQLRDEFEDRKINALVADNPENVPDYLHELPAKNRGHAIDEVVNEWRMIDPAVLQKWIDDSTDPEIRATLQSHALKSELRNNDFADAEKRALELLRGSSAQAPDASAFNQLVAGLASIDSARGIAFLQQMPAGELRDQATSNFVRTWAGLDPVSAADWLAKSPPSAGRDLAIGEIVTASRDDPESALANAAGIADPKLRLNAARAVLRVWRDADAGKAAALLPTSGFPADELPALRVMLGLDPAP